MEDFAFTSLSFTGVPLKLCHYRAGNVGRVSPEVDRTGLLLWPCSRSLCDFVSGSAADIIEIATSLAVIRRDNSTHSEAKSTSHHRVIELGAGATGAAGILWSLMYSGSVKLTDQDDASLVLLRSNVRNNNSDAVVQKLSWGKEVYSVLEEGRDFSVILASDVLYPGQLLSTVAGFFDKVNTLLSQGGVLILSYQPRGRWFFSRMLEIAYTKNLRAFRPTISPQHAEEGKPIILIFRRAHRQGEEVAEVKWQEVLPETFVNGFLDIESGDCEDLIICDDDLWTPEEYLE